MPLRLWTFKVAGGHRPKNLAIRLRSSYIDKSEVRHCLECVWPTGTLFLIPVYAIDPVDLLSDGLGLVLRFDESRPTLGVFRSDLFDGFFQGKARKRLTLWVQGPRTRLPTAPVVLRGVGSGF
ncbi:hypothetical protein CCR92_12370 [Rhodospirillum rubrum]|nr:hypothetical protein [Rhodospirillum rubrum]HCF18879.1 hypothetical protein [Rhodospirillum rubrum]